MTNVCYFFRLLLMILTIHLQKQFKITSNSSNIVKSPLPISLKTILMKVNREIGFMF